MGTDSQRDANGTQTKLKQKGKGMKERRIRSKTGAEYTVTDEGKRGWKAERVETGSTVRISIGKVSKTIKHLREVGPMPFRSIDYTVAIETVVVWVLEDLIEIDHTDRVYRWKGY